MRLRDLIPRRKHHATDEAREARERAEQALVVEWQRLEETKAETPHYADLAQSLRDVRERNHFAEAIANVWGGKP